MSTKPDDIPAVLRERFDYDAETGAFTWRPRDPNVFPSERIWKNWTTRFAGKPAFTSRTSDGYTQVELAINGKRVRILGHVAAFAITEGRLPTDELDHRNRIRDDNRRANIRGATRAENNRNVVKPSRYLTGARPRGRRWEARICHNRKPLHIGVYDTEREAYAAYLAKAAELHGDFAAIRNGGA